MTTPSPIRIALVNDYQVVLAGVRAMLRPFSDRVEVVELDANTPVAQPVHIALYDTYGQDHSALTSLREQLANRKVAKVALYCWTIDENLTHAALAAGIDGVLAKSMSAPQLVAALEAIAHGRRVVSPPEPTLRDVEPEERGSTDWPGRESGLSMREAEMMALITQGLSNAEIAERTRLSINSVKSYVQSAYKKVGVNRRSQAAAWGIDNNLVPDRSRRRP